MNRRYASPQELLGLMRPWFERIERGAGVTLTSTVLNRDSFELVARWKNDKEHKRRYYISTMKRDPCDYAKAFLLELLEQRGVV